LKKNKESKYKEVLKYIEKIIDGSITFDENHEFIMYKQKGLDIELPVYSTSSMVKSLSVFYLYLSKLAQGKDLIVLDEPEMNLHPKAQTEFLELLTIFINGLDREDRNLLILTTHTPYILDHLENLINAFDISKNLNAHELKQLKENFFLKTEKAFINPKNVAVYHFRKDGKVENIFNEEEKSINEETFFNISDKILDISSTIESLKIKKLLNN
jgi:predicted ATPase